MSAPVSRALRARRSVRHYTANHVARELIADVIADAAWAPSGGDDQPWGVVAVAPPKARELRERYEARAWHALAPKMASVVERQLGAGQPADVLVERVLAKLVSEARSTGAPWLLFVHGPSRVEDEAARLRTFHRALASRVPAAELPSHEELTAMCGPVHAGVVAASIAGFAYALTLAAHARGLGSCIQHHWLVWRDSLAAELELPAGRTLASAVLVGESDGSSAALLRAAERAARRPVDVSFK